MRYLLKKSETDPLWLVVTDTEAQVVCRFKQGEFNDSQKFTPLFDMDFDGALKLPRIAREMTDWLMANHSELLF